MRALEVYRVSGVSMSEHRRRQALENASQPGAGTAGLPYTVAQFAIAPGLRSVLHERIARRFHLMLEQGFVEEVERLRQRGDLHAGLPSIRAVGYRQVWEYLEGQLDRADMVERGIIATRQLAKRQYTWLRGWQGLQWLDSQACDNLSRALKCLESVSILG